MQRIRLSAAVAAIALLVSGCWLQPRFDAGRSNWAPDEDRLTSTTVAELEELWSTEVAPGVNAPIAVGGGIFVSTTSARAARVDAATGDVVWTRVFDELLPSLDDPAHVDGQVAIPWSIGRIGNIFRLSPRTGEILDGSSIVNTTYSDIAVADGTLAYRNAALLPPGDFAVSQVDWKFTAGLFGSPLTSDYAIVGDRILWSNGADALGFSPACPRYPDPVPPSIGCAPDWSTGLAGVPVGGPARVSNEQVVYATSVGRVAMLDVATGEVAWTADIGAAPAAAPAVAGGKILVATTDGRLVALPAMGCGTATCTPLWEAPTGANASEAPAVAGDVVYVGTTSGAISAFALHGCGAATCTPLTTVDTGDAPITGGPIVDDGRLVAGTQDGRLVAFGLP
jgi:outer membrane protein assembly factor BamB